MERKHLSVLVPIGQEIESPGSILYIDDKHGYVQITGFVSLAWAADSSLRITYEVAPIKGLSPEMFANGAVGIIN